MNFKNLLHTTEQKYQQYRPQIRTLKALGITKDLQMGLKTSQIHVTYPPTQCLTPTNDPKEVYADLRGRNTLYIHIPFCTGICTYCNYARTAASNDSNRVLSYPDLLEKEAQLLSKRFNRVRIPVESIYIGGGTPTLLAETELEKVLQIISQRFELTNEGEFTLEGSPETITAEKVVLAQKYGVNRVSFGAESFDDGILKQIGRRHTADQICTTMNTIRRTGISNIDFDLIRGLPEYSIEMIIFDLQKIAQLQPNSVSSYQYSLKPQSLDSKKELTQTSEENLIRMHILFREGMTKLGYTENPVDFFSIDPKYQFKHQILKWQCDVNQLALGLGSYGFCGNTQFINTVSRREYGEMLRQGSLPVSKAYTLSPEELMRRNFLFNLKTQVDISKFEQRFSIHPLQASFSKELTQLIDAKAIQITDSSIKLTEVGSLFADWIQSKFLSPEIAETTLRHIRLKK